MNDERNYSIDTFKFFAALSVVGIHTQPFANLEQSIYQNIYFILRVLFSFAVPFFFMSSGYLLYRGVHKIQDRKIYILRYLKKIATILVATLICYIIFNLFKFILSSNPTENIKSLFYSIFKLRNIYYGIDEGGMFHLWYLFALIYIVILLYIFNNRTNQLFFISIFLHVIGNWIQIKNVGINTRDALFYGLFYTMLGYYMCDNEEFIRIKISKISQINLIFLLLISNIIEILEAYLMTSRTYYFSTILVSISIFLIIIKNKNILKNSYINQIGKDCLGIYLMHVMVLDIIYLFIIKLNLSNLTDRLIWHIMITPVVFVISWRIYIIMKQLVNKIKVKNIKSSIVVE